MTTLEYLLLIALVALGMLGVFRALDAGVRDVSEHHARRIAELTWPSGSVPVASPPRAGSPLDPSTNGGAAPPGEAAPAGDAGDGAERGGDEGCSGFWGCVGSGLEQAASSWWGYEKGVFGAAWDDVSGLVVGAKDFVVTLFTDPKALWTGAVDTAKYVFEHPGEVLQGLVWDEESSAAWARGDYFEAVGRTAWNVGSWAIPGVNVAKVVAKGSKIVRTAREVASHVPDSKKDASEAPCVGAACSRPDGSCFAAGTLVHTAQGPLAIERVATGDLIWSRSEQTGEVQLRRVTRRFVTPDQPVQRLAFEAADGALETLTVTPEHPFWTGHGWVAAGELQPDDRVLLRSGDEVSVRGAEALAERITVYNFEVEGFHTYFVGAEGLWVHNDCEEEGAPKAPEGGYEQDPDQPDPDSTEGATTRADDPAAGSPEHRAQRWKEYQERGGAWDYERWSKTYENNMERATKAQQAEEAYRDRLGWGQTQVTVEVEGVPRRLDIADAATQRAVEVKMGAQYATQENLWEIARDEILREQGWDIRWHFEGHVSQPLKDALDQAGIPYDIDP
jgi:hypothetical protein